MSFMGGGAGGGGAGGGGAGGGGAGGGGAGGGGAGGGGAGGGGAGGGGAGGTGHAGGPSSTLLNTALAVTHDAVVGFWDGSADDTRAGGGGRSELAGVPDPKNPIDYLEPNRRIALLVSELSGRFQVAGDQTREKAGTYSPGHAEVKVDNHRIYSTTAPELDTIHRQLIWIRNYADLRYDRLSEINVQLTDLLSFFGAAAQLDASGKKYTLELLTAVQSLAYALEMQVKNLCWTPRPISMSQKVQPVIQTPDHSSYPSGHSVEAFALATLLVLILYNDPKVEEQIKGADKTEQSQLFRIAHRIATNRTVAGVHYPIDSAAGARLGISIAEAVWAIMRPISKDNPKNKVIEAIEYEPPKGSAASDYDFLLSQTDLDRKGGEKKTRLAGPVAKAYFTQIKREWGIS